MDIKVPFPLFADHPELDAQVPAEISPRQSQRHRQAALLHVQDVRLQGDPVHRRDGLSEREGELILTVQVMNECHISIDLPQITQLKIDHNPFAKGFRDTGAAKGSKR